MNHHHYTTLAVLLASMIFSSLSIQAAERTPQASVTTGGEAHALSPAQLTVIRGISRNVLVAKKSGVEDSPDLAQLANLRASLDQLVAADLDPSNRVPITVQGQESSPQRRTREKVTRLREVTRTDAQAVGAQLRQHGELKMAHARSAPEADSFSAGLPIGMQRAHLFERWAQKLDAALADGNEDRTIALFALREQLRANHGSLSEVPTTHGTPMLQAMPASFVPTPNNGVATEQGK